jgi:hypothetical protein
MKSIVGEIWNMDPDIGWLCARGKVDRWSHDEHESAKAKFKAKEG